MSQQDGAIPAPAAARETAPATLKSAIRRIVRSAIGKRLAMDESQPGATSGFKRVFPIAWAITHLADVQAQAQPHTAMIVRDEEASDGDLRWYSLIPTLMSAHKDWSVAAVVAQFEAGQSRKPPAALYAMAPPSFTTDPVHVVARTAPRPGVLVFSDIESRGVDLLKDLMRRHLAQWMQQGTQVILLGDTQAGMAIVIDAIQALGGAVGPMQVRNPLTLVNRARGENAPSDCEQSIACRLTRAPTRTEVFATVAQGIAPHLDVILETFAQADAEGTSAATCLIGNSHFFENKAYSLTLPLQHFYFQIPPTSHNPAEAKIFSSDRATMMMMSLDMVDDVSELSIEVPAERHLSHDLLMRQDNAGVLERYRAALRLYAQCVSPQFITVSGEYELDDQGCLIALDDELDPAFFALEPEIEPEIQPIAPAAAEAAERQSEPLPQPPQTSALALPEAVAPPPTKTEPPVAREPEPDPAKAVLAQTMRELQDKLRQVTAERDAALRQVAALQRANPKDPGDPEPDASSASDTAAWPTTWEELFRWAHEKFPNEIIFTSRARRAARKSAYRQIPTAAQAIDFLGTEYRNARLIGDAQARSARDARVKQLGMQVGPTGDATTNHRTAELYKANWEGKRHTLDCHLQGSSSRDQTKALRIYFTFLAERGAVLIGHLPTHLANTLS